MVFDVWQAIEEDGAEAVLDGAESLSALGWAEIAEVYPDLVPDAYCHWDVRSDPHLIRESPFVEFEDNGGRSFEFRAKDVWTGVSLATSIDTTELIGALLRKDFHASDAESAFGGILVCSCGVAGCDGIWSQTFHVSDKMVHWSVRRYDDRFELFFDREVYETGAIAMLKTLVEKPDVFSMPYGSLYEDDHGEFVACVRDLLGQSDAFRRIWDGLPESVPSPDKG